MSFLFCTELETASPLVHPRADVPLIRCGIDGNVKEVLRQDSLRTTCLLQARVKLRGLPTFECRSILVRIRGRTTIAPGDLVSLNAHARPATAPGLPNEFNEAAYLRSRGSLLLAECKAVNCRIIRPGNSLRRIAAQAAGALEAHIHQTFPPATRAYALALLTGNRRGIATEQRRDFVRTGTAHVLALSGMHVLLIASLLLLPLAYIRVRSLQWVILLLVLAAFCCISGLRESTLRAVTMFIIWRGLAGLERRPQLLNILCLTALVMLAIEPAQLNSIGFQLSFAAVAGIALFYGPLQESLQRWWPRKFLRSAYVQNSLCLSLAVGITVNPLIAHHFGMFAVFALVANLIIIPLVMLAMVQATLATLTALFWPALGELFALTFDVLLRLALYLNSILARLPTAVLIEDAAIFAAWGLAFATVWCMFAARRRQALLRACFAGAILAGLWFLQLQRPAAIELIARRNFVALLLRDQANARHTHSTLLLQDRHLDLVYNRSDKGLLDYALRDCDSLTVICNGPSSLALLRHAQYSRINKLVVPSLLFKRRDMFAALDSLSAHRVRIRRLPYSVESLNLAELSTGGNLLYNLVCNTVEISSKDLQRPIVCLPQFNRDLAEEWQNSLHKLHLPAHANSRPNADSPNTKPP